MTDGAWTDDMSVGVDQIDEEHKYLFFLLSSALRAIAERNIGAVLTIFHDLTDYIDVHFGHEEEVMKAMGYPERDAHCTEHAALAHKAYCVINSLRLGDTLDRGTEFTDFLKDWLTNHIMVSDMKYGAYLRSQ
jgi:hemerythrin